MDVIKLEDRIPMGVGMCKTIAIRLNKGKRCYLYEALGFEVFIPKVTECCDWVDGVPKPNGIFKERYPKDEDFGKTAWCFRTYEKALKKFNFIESLTEEEFNHIKS